MVFPLLICLLTDLLLSSQRVIYRELPSAHVTHFCTDSLTSSAFSLANASLLFTSLELSNSHNSTFIFVQDASIFSCKRVHFFIIPSTKSFISASETLISLDSISISRPSQLPCISLVHSDTSISSLSVSNSDIKSITVFDRETIFADCVISRTMISHCKFTNITTFFKDMHDGAAVFCTPSSEDVLITSTQCYSVDNALYGTLVHNPFSLRFLFINSSIASSSRSHILLARPHSKSNTDRQVISSTSEDTITLSSSTFSSLSTDDSGAAIYLSSYSGSVTILSCLFQECSATSSIGSGGAIYISGVTSSAVASVSISECTFRRCTAAFVGGAIYAECEFTCERTAFLRCNVSAGGTGGGGICIPYIVANITLNELGFVRCNAPVGGCLYVTNLFNSSITPIIAASATRLLALSMDDWYCIYNDATGENKTAAIIYIGDSTSAATHSTRNEGEEPVAITLSFTNSEMHHSSDSKIGREIYIAPDFPTSDVSTSSTSGYTLSVVNSDNFAETQSTDTVNSISIGGHDCSNWIEDLRWYNSTEFVFLVIGLALVAIAVIAVLIIMILLCRYFHNKRIQRRQRKGQRTPGSSPSHSPRQQPPPQDPYGQRPAPPYAQPSVVEPPQQ